MHKSSRSWVNFLKSSVLATKSVSHKQVHVRVETTNSPFTGGLAKGDVLQMPIGHMEGNYFCTPDELQRLEAEDRIAFRYATPAGEITPEANPNGSLSNIAGILNAGRNVLGMMPHPDRSSEQLLGSADGRQLRAPGRWAPRPG